MLLFLNISLKMKQSKQSIYNVEKKSSYGMSRKITVECVGEMFYSKKSYEKVRRKSRKVKNVIVQCHE